MEEPRTYTVATPWGYQYQITDLTLAQANELIEQKNGVELEHLTKRRTHGVVFLLANGAVVATSYADATMYESLKGYLSNLYTSGMLTRKHISKTYPIPQIEYTLDGRRICYFQISLEEGEVLEAVSAEVSSESSPKKNLWRIPEGEMLYRKGAAFFLYQSEKDYFNLEAKYAMKEKALREMAAAEAAASEMLGRNPYGQSFPGKVETLITELPGLMFAPREIFDYSIQSLPKIEKHLFRHLFTAIFSDRLFLPLLAYMGQVQIINFEGEWLVEYNSFFDTWIPCIKTKEGLVKKMYIPLLKLLNPNDEKWFPLATVLNA
ncbi:MAG: hypothetical protein H6564_16365 [Lewinellaceae bacterium]|nr:hypothetical protein [Lewinellaceae bacterium]